MLMVVGVVFCILEELKKVDGSVVGSCGVFVV